MEKEISHSFKDETPESKARWFQSLSISERMDMLCSFTDMILDNNPGIVEKRDAKQTVSDELEKPYSDLFLASVPSLLFVPQPIQNDQSCRSQEK